MLSWSQATLRYRPSKIAFRPRGVDLLTRKDDPAFGGFANLEGDTWASADYEDTTPEDWYMGMYLHMNPGLVLRHWEEYYSHWLSIFPVKFTPPPNWRHWKECVLVYWRAASYKLLGSTKQYNAVLGRRRENPTDQTQYLWQPSVEEHSSSRWTSFPSQAASLAVNLLRGCSAESPSRSPSGRCHSWIGAISIKRRETFPFKSAFAGEQSLSLHWREELHSNGPSLRCRFTSKSLLDKKTDSPPKKKRRSRAVKTNSLLPHWWYAFVGWVALKAEKGLFSLSALFHLLWMMFSYSRSSSALFRFARPSRKKNFRKKPLLGFLKPLFLQKCLLITLGFILWSFLLEKHSFFPRFIGGSSLRASGKK
jgi:hypothetical protein